MGDQTPHTDNAHVVLGSATPALLALLYASDGSAMGFEELRSRIQPVVLESTTWSTLATPTLKELSISQAFERLWAVLGRTGIVAVTQPAESETPASIELTLLGRVTAAQLLERQGITIPIRRMLPDPPGGEVGQQATLWP